MDGILITVLIVVGFLIYKMIVSGRKQENYKRWKAVGGTSKDDTFRCSSSNKVPVFDEEAVIWCANLLGMEASRLREILQNVSAHYHVFWLRKRKGGYRIISAPDKELKSIQDTIYQRILLPVHVHPCATGFQHHRSVVDNARPHLGKKYVLKTDIHDFFCSIRSLRVKKKFEEIGYPKNISKVLGELCCFRRHLPQGASTSPVLSNIIAYEMDCKLEAMAVEFGLTYSRYADDLTFSSDEFSKEQVLSRIKQILREEKFEPNHKKTCFLNEHNKKIITGVSISSGVKLTIPKAKKREIRKNVYFVLTRGLGDHKRRIGSHDPVYLKRLIGMLCYWRSIEPDNAYVAKSIAALKQISK